MNRRLNGIGSSWLVNLVTNWLFLKNEVQNPAKYKLKSSHFALTSDIFLLSWYIGGTKGIFLPFNNVFRRDQYFLGLRLFSDKLIWYLRDITWYFVIFPLSVIGFYVNEILNISKVALKIMIPFTNRVCLCKFDINFLSNFWFFYQIMVDPCHQKPSSYLA